MVESPSKILKQQTKRGLYWNLLSQIGNYGIQFVIGIILARILTSSDYGTTAMPMIFLAVAQCFIDSGFTGALIRKPELSEKDLSTAFYFSVGVGLFFYMTLFLSSSMIADFYNTPILEDLLKFSALGTLFSPMASVQYLKMKRNLDFKTMTKISLTCKVATGMVGIIMAINGCGVWSLVIPGVVSGLLNVILAFYVSRWIPKTGWSKESFSYLWNFGSKMLASSLLDITYNNIYPIVIGKFYSAADLGIYTRAQGYAQIPSQNITGSIQSVTYPVLSKMQNDAERMQNGYRKMLKTTAFVIFPMMMMLSALSAPFINIVITAKWEACIILLQLICFSMMWYPIHAINLNLLQVKGRSDLFFRLEVVKKIIGVIIMIIVLPQGLVAMCIGGIVSSLLCLIVNTYYTGKLINLGYLKQMRDLMPTLLLSFVMFGVIHLFNYFVDNMYIQLFGGGCVGAAIYIGGSILFKFSELNEIKYMLKR